MQEVIVRAEVPEDVRAIDVVNLSAFQGEEEARLVSAIRRSADFVPELSLVAELNGRIVGHLLLSKVKLQRGGESHVVLALGPMSVVPSQSHRGIGSELIRAATQRAREMRYVAIVVAGQPDYYQRLDFKPVSTWDLVSNLRLPEDALTAMELVPGALNGGGKVIYPDVFAEIF
ncbi:MAG: N-acetyltransferase [Thiohalobacteraceae bacterium]|nr:N-acetyltransferase [Gammaproteobacteria bacterium]